MPAECILGRDITTSVHDGDLMPCQQAAAKPPSTVQAAAVSVARHCLQDAKKRLEQQAREQAEKLRQEKLRQQQAKNKGRGRL